MRSKESEARTKFIPYLTPHFLLFAFYFLLFTFSAWAQEGLPEGPERAVAKVNDATITVKMLKQAIEGRIPATGHRMLSEKRLSEIRREELDKLVIRELLFQEAKRLGIQAESQEIESEIKKIKGRFLSEEEFRQALQRRGLMLSDLREGLERHLMIQKVTQKEVYSGITPTDAQLKEYYEGHKEQFRVPGQIRLRLILVSVAPSAQEADWEEGRTKAQGLAERARAGEDFASLAARFSDDESTREKGGDAGLLHMGRLPYPQLESVAFSHNVGEVSEPVRILYGYSVFKVEEKRPAKQLSYDELNKELLRREMRSSAAKSRLKNWITDLKTRAEITIIK